MLQGERGESTRPHAVVVDEIVRDSARQMLAWRAGRGQSRAIEAAHERDEARSAAGPQRNHEQREVTTAAGAVPASRRGSTTSRVDEATGQRSGSPRRSCRRGPGSPRRWSSAAAVVPARTVQRRLRPSAGAVPGHRPRPVVDDDHPADQGLAGRGEAFNHAPLAEDYVSCGSTGSHLKVSVSSRTRCACW